MFFRHQLILQVEKNASLLIPKQFIYFSDFRLTTLLSADRNPNLKPSVYKIVNGSVIFNPRLSYFNLVFRSMGQRSLGILFQTMDIRFLIQYLAKSFKQINLENLNFKIISIQEDSGLFFLSGAWHWWVEQSAGNKFMSYKHQLVNPYNNLTTVYGITTRHLKSLDVT